MICSEKFSGLLMKMIWNTHFNQAVYILKNHKVHLRSIGNAAHINHWKAPNIDEHYVTYTMQQTTSKYNPYTSCINIIIKVNG